VRVVFSSRLIAVTSGLVLIASSQAFAQTTRDASACGALTALQVRGHNVSITKAEWFAAGATPPQAGPGAAAAPVKLPAYCRLDGVLDRRTGADGKSYGIGFALALPGEWNGRFLFQGGGGLNGSVQPPLGAVATSGTPALARGFAVVSTDTGHSGQGFDASFMQEQQANLDFAYQAVGRVAVLAKQIIAQHYAKPPDRSYFAGCSTGGREAMLMTQRYPTYFDGVISGVAQRCREADRQDVVDGIARPGMSEAGTEQGPRRIGAERRQAARGDVVGPPPREADQRERAAGQVFAHSITRW